MSGPESEKATFLAECMVFRSLNREDHAALAARAQRRRYRAGQMIFRSGDPGDSLLAVVTGTVRIAVNSAKGREIILADLPSGEVFGEVALLDGLGRSANALALTDVELLTLERSHIMSFLSQRPDACLRLLALVCGRLRAADERMLDIADADVAVRLAKAILRRTPVGGGGPDRPPAVRLTQSDLASMISGSREAVNRQLAAWQRSGIVEVLGGSIVVLRAADLAVVAGLV